MNIQVTLQSAIARHQAGQFAEAETLYRQILSRAPRHPDALHFLGLLAHHRGQHDVAVDLISQALREAPGHAPCHCNLGSALQALGRIDEAIASYRHALTLQRDFAEAHLNLGNALQVKGLPDEAIASYRRALRHRPQYAEAYYNLGRVHQAQDRWAEAISAYRRAVSIRPDYAEAHNNLGNALRSAGQLDEAIASYQQAVAVQPGHVEAHNNLGLAYQANGQPDAAKASLERALALKPDYAEAHNNLGSVFAAEGQTGPAISCYRHALRLKPDFAEAHNNLGNALLTEGDLQESIASYQRALASRPAYADALNNLGNALQTVGQLDAAIRNYEQALALQPDLADAWWNLAYALLLKGDYAAGWPLYEWRWKAIGKHGALRDFAAPLWLGESPLAGRTILLHHEQGLGDTLQMLRYVPLLADQGARVIIEVPPSLEALAAGVPGAATVVIRGQSLPAFDVHCPCMSLPLAFGTTLATIPASVPYLFVPEATRDTWRERLGKHTGLRIGLAWSGSGTHSNDRHRSLPLGRLLPLLRAGPGFHSLQKEYRPDDRTALAGESRLRDYSADLADLADTAGLIGELDLVITVDTAVAHLAGALGKPVWLLLPFAPDYRRLLERIDSPWYPTMRLFRQPAFGDWGAVIRTVSAALASLVADAGAGSEAN